jgi:hypothetical protein
MTRHRWFLPETPDVSDLRKQTAITMEEHGSAPRYEGASRAPDRLRGASTGPTTGASSAPR